MKSSEYQHQADKNTPFKAVVIVSTRVYSYYVLWSAKPGLIPGVGIGGQMGLLQDKPSHRPREIPGPVGRKEMGKNLLCVPE